MKLILISILISFSSIAFGQSKTAISLPSTKIESYVEPRIQEAYELIDDIKKQNPPDNFKFEYRAGLMQVFSNSVDAVSLNKLKTISFGGIETVTKIYRDVGFELRGYYAKNFLFPSEAGSPNGPNAFQISYDAGLRYRFILEETQIEDYVALKLLYHKTENNFKLSSESTLFMKEYSGTTVGIERNIPVTPKVGIQASLDVTFINNTKSDTAESFVNSGIGFQMRGASSYRVEWFGVPSRIGAAYWQGGFVNRLSPGTQENLGRTSHVQTFRAVSMSYLLNF